MSVYKNCSTCGRKIAMGKDGIYDHETQKPFCDGCAGVERDPEGDAWKPGEIQHTYLPVNGDPAYTVTREEAFR